MDNSDGSPPPYMIRAAELYPKDPIEKEDTQLNIPYQERKFCSVFIAIAVAARIHLTSIFSCWGGGEVFGTNG